MRDDHTSWPVPARYPIFVVRSFFLFFLPAASIKMAPLETASPGLCDSLMTRGLHND
jgi:hypothetical protein